MEIKKILPEDIKSLIGGNHVAPYLYNSKEFIEGKTQFIILVPIGMRMKLLQQLTRF